MGVAKNPSSALWPDPTVRDGFSKNGSRAKVQEMRENPKRRVDLSGEGEGMSDVTMAFVCDICFREFKNCSDAADHHELTTHSFKRVKEKSEIKSDSTEST